jgi:gag-polypeptide of LTR copia-type
MCSHLQSQLSIPTTSTFILYAMSEDNDNPISQIERLNETNYRSWSTQVRAVLPHQSLPPSQSMRHRRRTRLMRTRSSSMVGTRMPGACATLLPTISGSLMTYVEDEDGPAKVWTILHDPFRPTTDLTLAEALKDLVTLRVADNRHMEAHTHNFTSCKRRVEEHGVVLTDIVYRTFFLISMPTTYQMTVTAIESQSNVTLEVAQNRLLEEWKKRKGQRKRGLLVTTTYAKSQSQVATKGVPAQTRIRTLIQNQLYSALIARRGAKSSQHAGPSIPISRTIQQGQWQWEKPG